LSNIRRNADKFAFEMIIERGKIREFARATKSKNPEFLEGPCPIIPPTFLASATFWQDESVSPWRSGALQTDRLLHGEQTYIFYAEPPRAGQVLSGNTRLGRTFEKNGKRGGLLKFTEVITEFRSDKGNLVAESISTLIETSKSTTETTEP